MIEALGVEIRCGVTVGQDVSFADLRRDHAAVIIAVGAKRSRGLGLPGERGPRVYGGVDLLRAVALGEPLDLGQEVVVIGGGNVAYDVARTVVRQAAYDTARTAARLPGTHRVRLVSLETLEEMPADTVEIREGDEEGIERLNGWGPVEISRDEWRQRSRASSSAAACGSTTSSAASPRSTTTRSGRSVACDTVLLAAGQTTDLAFLEDGGADVEQFRPGWPKVDPETLETTAPGVFVAGDLAHGTRLLIDAVASGKKARALGLPPRHRPRRSDPRRWRPTSRSSGYRRERGYEALRRVEVPTLSPAERLARSRRRRSRSATARSRPAREASRCLDCGVTPVFDGERCVLCGGCVDVCPTLCLKLVPLAELEPTAELDAAIEGTLGARRGPRRELRHPQGRGPLHPLRRVRDALPRRRDHDGTRSVQRELESQA